jgi:hypothetical protein
MTQRILPLAALTAAVAIAGITGACTFRAVQGSGPVTTETRDAKAFTKLESSFGIIVDLTVGEAPSIAVEAPRDLLPIISTEISGDTLKIKGTTDFVGRSPVTVHVATPDLESVTLFGGSIVKADDLALDSLGLSISGGAEFTASGSAASLAIDGSGGAQVHVDQLTAGLVTLELSGGAQANVNATDTVTGDVSGGAHATVHGPAQLNVDTSAGGSVDRG